MAGRVKIHYAVHHAMIRDGAMLDVHFLKPFHQVLDTARAVQKAVFRMQVQVGKRHGGSPFGSQAKAGSALIKLKQGIAFQQQTWYNSVRFTSEKEVKDIA